VLWDFRGKAAIVTGAGRGIGRAASLAFADCGAKVAVTDVDPDLAEEMVAPIEQKGGSARYITGHLIPIDGGASSIINLTDEEAIL